MRVMVMVRATAETEAGVMPDTAELEAMGSFNQRLFEAGIMKTGEGLHPSARGTRVRFDGPTRHVVDGPFLETRELIAGFWEWEVASMEEAVEWVKQAPFGDGQVIEIRRIFEADDFGEAFTPELRAQEERLRERERGG
jgi:hypothetical protein